MEINCTEININKLINVQVFIICQYFQEGVVIVDSPGFGEHGRKSSQVERYLAKSFGAIYVVNTASAGGVNSGRVRITLVKAPDAIINYHK